MELTLPTAGGNAVVHSNILFVAKGRKWKFPATMAALDELSNIVAVVWRAKRVVAETYGVVLADLSREEVGEVEVTGVDFLSERVRYNCMTWDLWNWMVRGLGGCGVREFSGCALILMFLFVPSIYIAGGAFIF